MAARLFVNIQNVAAGGEALRGVQSLSISEDGDDIEASGDADTVLTGLFMGVARITATIVLNDLGNNVRRGNGVDQVSFTALSQSPGGSNVAYTISNGKVSSRSDSAPHNAAGSCTIVTKHYSNDGTTSPLSIS